MQITEISMDIKKLTRMMRNIEKVISYYNKKYNFNIESASIKEQKEYYGLLRRWDFLKIRRDTLK